MPVIFKEPIAYFDVDETLLEWNRTNSSILKTVVIIHPKTGEIFNFEVITENVEALKLHKARGHTIVVWSAGGADWTVQAVKALNLEQYVDACLSKPTWYYDDAKSNDFMPEHIRKHKRLKK